MTVLFWVAGCSQANESSTIVGSDYGYCEKVMPSDFMLRMSNQHIVLQDLTPYFRPDTVFFLELALEIEGVKGVTFIRVGKPERLPGVAP